MSRWSKLDQKECKIRHDWVEKVIKRELCKRKNFDRAAKWYMHKPESILENETYKILSDFDKQTDPFIAARRPDLMLKKKRREFAFCGFCRSGRPQRKRKS